MESDFRDFLISVESTIKSSGFIQNDSRFNRETYTLIGYHIRTNDKVLEYIKSEKPISKYREDWERMKSTFLEIIKEVKENPDSRRMVSVNTDEYLKIYPCFLSIQFLKDKDGRYCALVHQRSGDLEKMKDDWIFFGYLMKKFEDLTGLKTKQLSVTYGNIHTKKESGTSHVDRF